MIFILKLFLEWSILPAQYPCGRRYKQLSSWTHSKQTTWVVNIRVSTMNIVCLSEFDQCLCFCVTFWTTRVLPVLLPRVTALVPLFECSHVEMKWASFHGKVCLKNNHNCLLSIKYAIVMKIYPLNILSILGTGDDMNFTLSKAQTLVF